MNRKNRKSLYLHSTILRGRRLKDENEGGGGTGEANNEGVTGEQNSNANSDGNNSGQEFDAKGFWNDPNAKDGQNTNQEPEVPADFGTNLVADISNFKAPDVFTADIVKQIADGDVAGVNTAINGAIQAAVRQSVVLAARIMQQFEGTVEARMNNMIGSTQTAERDEKLLETNFATYSDPAMKGMIQGVFQQSLKHTGNDRTKAIAMTKDMLKSMGQLGSKDFGIDSAPRNPDDFQGDGPSSLVRDLLAMS